MIRKKITTIGFCLVILFEFVMPQWPVASASGSFKWHTYDEGMALSRNQNKKVIINFYADWCSFCKKMDRETYKNKTVADFLRDNFIAIKVNTDKESRIAANYRVKGLPSTWFVTEGGEKISNLPGFVPPDLFVNVLAYVQTDSYKVMSFKKFLAGQTPHMPFNQADDS